MAAGRDDPTDGAAHVKAEFGLDVTPAVFSTYKAAERKKAGRAADKAVPTAAVKAAGKNADPVAFVRQVKELVDVYGAAAVKDMVRVFEE